MTYTLWEIGSANLVQAYDNERDALALVLRGIERNGPQDTHTLALAVEDDDGSVTFLAQGEELAERARREFAEQHLTG